MPLPRLRAVALEATPRDPTTVGPEVWRNLEEVVARLGSERSTAIFGAAEAEAILLSWRRDGLGADKAKEVAKQLREYAFTEDEPGTVAVTMVVGKDEDGPGAVLVLAGIFDYLAAVAGEGRALRFKDEEASE